MDHLEIKNMCPQFLTADMERSIKFYTQNLGFEVSFRYEDFYCGISKDGFTIHLKLSLSETAEKIYRNHQEHVNLTFSVENIEEIYQKFQEKQVTIVQPLREMPYGKECYISDPYGYILAFLEEI